MDYASAGSQAALNPWASAISSESGNSALPCWEFWDLSWSSHASRCCCASSRQSSVTDPRAWAPATPARRIRARFSPVSVVFLPAAGRGSFFPRFGFCGVRDRFAHLPASAASAPRSPPFPIGRVLSRILHPLPILIQRISKAPAKRDKCPVAPRPDLLRDRQADRIGLLMAADNEEFL